MSHGIVGVEIDGSIAPDLLDEDDGVDPRHRRQQRDDAHGQRRDRRAVGRARRPALRRRRRRPDPLARRDADDIFDLDENSFGINVGGGVHALVRKNLGLRADLRYFRGVRDTDSGDDVDLELGSFDFWRASVGATFRF